MLEKIINENQGKGQLNYPSDLQNYTYVNSGKKKSNFNWNLYANKFIFGNWQNNKYDPNDYEQYRRRPQESLNNAIRE